MATATAFLYKHDDTYYLVTNWHNVTGFHPETKKRISKSSASPTGLEIALFSQQKPYIDWKHFTVPLYKNESPLWYKHPLHGEKIDVIAIELGKNDSSYPLKAINELEFDDEKPRVADTVFILGFPLGLNGGGNFPVWKKGTIATEPDIDIQKLPKLLIDTASRPGMSGSPVIYRRQGLHGMVNGKLAEDTMIGEIQNFCGIYSGRVQTNSDIDSQIGIVWKQSVIKEIIEGKMVDDKYFPHESAL